YVPDFVSNLVYAWESSYWRGFYERLARSFRLILFDKRGTGLSDGGGHGTRGRFGARRRSWRACAASGSRRGSVEVRVGIHGECERLEGKLGGITVPTGARIGALAGRGGGARLGHGPEANRVLSTVLVTDVVDSTARAAELGDRRWREVIGERRGGFTL
ncbi:MAG TPA: hypothetical protein VE440_04425, partial [Gaiellaceae bacterium]|nr:hypothetical protein [Gaiellaceae bacterium]